MFIENKNLIPRVPDPKTVKSHYRWAIFGALYGATGVLSGYSFGGALLIVLCCWFYRRTWRFEQLRLTRANRMIEMGDGPEDEAELHFPFCGRCRCEHEQGRHF